MSLRVPTTSTMVVPSTGWPVVLGLGEGLATWYEAFPLQSGQCGPLPSLRFSYQQKVELEGLSPISCLSILLKFFTFLSCSKMGQKWVIKRHKETLLLKLCARNLKSEMPPATSKPMASCRVSTVLGKQESCSLVPSPSPESPMHNQRTWSLL